MRKLLMEAPANIPLIDVGAPVILQLVEEAGTGKTKARGTFALADTPTSNRRIYPKPLWERETGKLQKAIEERKLFGTLDHPEDGRTRLSEVSHIITKLYLDGNQVIGEAEILDTIPGQNLKAIIKAGGRVGVSSRGVGSTQQVDEGELVQDDYNLTTFDFVANPAESSAYPRVVVEDKQHPQGEGDMQPNDETKKLIAEEVDKATKGLTEQHETEKTRMLSEAKALKTENGNLSRALAESQSTLKHLGLTMFLDGYLTETDNKAAIKELLGDIMLCESTDALKAKVDTIRKNVPPVSKPVTEQKDEVDVKALTEDLTVIRGQIQKLTEEREVQGRKIEEQAKAMTVLATEKSRLEEDLGVSVALAKNLGLRAYMERKLYGNPKAEKVRKMFEEQSPDTKEKVDALIESAKTPSEDYQHIRRGLGRAHPSEKAQERIEEGDQGAGDVAAGSDALNEELQHIGVTVDEVKKLSGS